MFILSHEYARKLNQLAEFLQSKPEFSISGYPYLYIHCYDKESFVRAVRAVGAGEKKFSDDEIQFHPSTGPSNVMIQIDAPRNKVCTLIQEAVWDCEPLLTPQEEEKIGEDPTNGEQVKVPSHVETDAEGIPF